MNELRFLVINEIININKNQIILYGGLFGIRDINLLESAIYEPMKTFEQKLLYEDIFVMAAVYAHGIIKNHPFVDGNKRTGILCALLFLHYNGLEANFNQDELFDLTMNIATSKISVEEIAIVFARKCLH